MSRTKTIVSQLCRSVVGLGLLALVACVPPPPSGAEEAMASACPLCTGMNHDKAADPKAEVASAENILVPTDVKQASTDPKEIKIAEEAAPKKNLTAAHKNLQDALGLIAAAEKDGAVVDAQAKDAIEKARKTVEDATKTSAPAAPPAQGHHH